MAGDERLALHNALGLQTPMALNHMILEKHWERGGLGRNLWNNTYRRRKTVLNILLTIHARLGVITNFISLNNRKRLETWIVHFWPQISTELGTGRPVPEKLAQDMTMELFKNYRRYWTANNANILPAGTLYTPPSDAPDLPILPAISITSSPASTPPSSYDFANQEAGSPYEEQQEQAPYQWERLAPSSPDPASKSLTELQQDSTNWQQWATSQLRSFRQFLQNGLGNFAKNKHWIDKSRLAAFNLDGGRLIGAWQEWHKSVKTYHDRQLAYEIREQQRQQQSGITDRATRKVTELICLENMRRGCREDESRLIQQSNLLLLDMYKQWQTPLSEEEWQHRLDWEELGFDYSANSTRYNAKFSVVHASSGISILDIPDLRLHRLIYNQQNPRSISHNRMWVDGLELRISGFRAILENQGAILPSQSIWLSRKSPAETDLSSTTGLFHLGSDLALVSALSTIMQRDWASFDGPRPVQSRHFLSGWPPEFTLVVRDDNPSEAQWLEVDRIRRTTAASRFIEAACTADIEEDHEARRAHIISAGRTLLSSTSETQEMQESGEMDWMEGIEGVEQAQRPDTPSPVSISIANEREEAAVLRLVFGEEPGMDPPAKDEYLRLFDEFVEPSAYEESTDKRPRAEEDDGDSEHVTQRRKTGKAPWEIA